MIPSTLQGVRISGDRLVETRRTPWVRGGASSAVRDLVSTQPSDSGSVARLYND